jgi:hypothetical protein
MNKCRARAAPSPTRLAVIPSAPGASRPNLENGGTLEFTQTIANHESPRTIKLYDRTREELSVDEIGRRKI